LAKRRNLVDLGTLSHLPNQTTRRKIKAVNAENMRSRAAGKVDGAECVASPKKFHYDFRHSQ
jgi:hypothetical protein